MKKILAVLLVMGFIAVSFTGISFAQGPGMNSGGRNYNSQSRGTDVGYNLVELTDSQTEKIAEFRDEFYNDTENLRDEMRNLNREIRDLEFRGASNAEIGEVEDKLEEFLTEMDEKRIDHQENLESILTDSQLETIEENRFEGQGQSNNSGKSNGRGSSGNGDKRSNNRR
ncbi:MAG: Spy/CpxP family protein refolding chaperone [Bacillota bacterium]